MFFNAKQYFKFLSTNSGHRQQAFQLAGYDPYGRLPEMTEEIAQKALDNLKKALVKRDTSLNGVYLTKWTRPWHVVPELIDFKVPKGDFGVGIEVEMGFKSLKASQAAAAHIADWDYVTLDYEGGNYPIEATFAPELASNLHNMLAVKYLDYLDANKAELVTRHSAGSMVGTHVNVSIGGMPRLNTPYLTAVNNAIVNLSIAEKEKYFGRSPYGTGNNFGKFIEWKLFNSQTSSDRLKQYINIAIELTKLAVEGGADKGPKSLDRYPYERYTITRDDVLAACERGYNKDRTVPVEEETAEVVENTVKAVSKRTARRRAA